MSSASDVILTCNGTLLAFIAYSITRISSNVDPRKRIKKRRKRPNHRKVG